MDKRWNVDGYQREWRVCGFMCIKGISGYRYTKAIQFESFNITPSLPRDISFLPWYRSNGQIVTPDSIAVSLLNKSRRRIEKFAWTETMELVESWREEKGVRKSRDPESRHRRCSRLFFRPRHCLFSWSYLFFFVIRHVVVVDGVVVVLVHCISTVFQKNLIRHHLFHRTPITCLKKIIYSSKYC